MVKFLFVLSVTQPTNPLLWREFSGLCVYRILVERLNVSSDSMQHYDMFLIQNRPLLLATDFTPGPKSNAMVDR